LKEPVRKILFFANQLELHLGDQPTTNASQMIHRIQHASERMGKLIDDLLMYAHFSQLPPSTTHIKLNVVVQQVLDNLEVDIQQNNAIITVGDLPEIQGHGLQLQQLFQNLLSNAVKYSKSDTFPIIEIAADRALEGNQEYQVVSVRDNGIGFDQAYAEKIFQIFSRLHGASEYGGHGVGLSIAKQVLENHNGFIRVTSQEGEGSIFEVYFPNHVLKEGA
jgi:light-regulated signal transduction histidine kinase (bacteriophytochrome)